MRILDAEQVHARLPWESLMQSLSEILGAGDEVGAPARTVIPVSTAEGSEQTMLLMPSWRHGALTGVKIVNHVPSNSGRGLPTIQAAFLVFDGTTGVPLAVLDGDALTVRRTAAISALAGTSLVRSDAARLLVVGTGQLAPMVARAHADTHDYRSIAVWGRDRHRAELTATTISAATSSRVDVEVSDDLGQAVSSADVIVSVTGAAEPLIHGDDVSEGTHVSLVGSYKADMCEADAELMSSASVFADTRAGALAAGELARPIEAGRLAPSVILADLSDLVAGRHGGRRSAEEITVFKSAGFALADLAAAQLVLEAAHG